MVHRWDTCTSPWDYPASLGRNIGISPISLVSGANEGHTFPCFPSPDRPSSLSTSAGRAWADMLRWAAIQPGIPRIPRSSHFGNWAHTDAGMVALQEGVWDPVPVVDGAGSA
jgi:hypothetical protein